MNKTKLSKSNNTNSATLKKHGRRNSSRKKKCITINRNWEKNIYIISLLIKKHLMCTFCMLRKTQHRHQQPLLLIYSTVSSVLQESQHPLNSSELIKLSTFFFPGFGKSLSVSILVISSQSIISLLFSFITSLITLLFLLPNTFYRLCELERT